MARNSIAEFNEHFPSIDSYWRSIILFGQNVASYKFALAQSINEIVPTGKTIITLEDLAEPFSRHICQHIATAPKQATSQSSRFLRACQNYNDGKISHQELIDTTVQLGFVNVIDAFHIVNKESLPIQFFTKDYQPRNKRIILTDNAFKLLELPYAENFSIETESRWNLVETAWQLGISRNLLDVRYDDDKNIILKKKEKEEEMVGDHT